MKNMKNEIRTIEEFARSLPLIDWYFQMSDDPRAYRRGEEQVRSYRELAEANGVEWVEAFKAEQKKHRIR